MLARPPRESLRFGSSVGAAHQQGQVVFLLAAAEDLDSTHQLGWQFADRKLAVGPNS